MQEIAQERTEKSEKSSGPIGWAELGLLPDRLIRAGIRRLNRQRLEDIGANDLEHCADEMARFVANMRTAEVAP